MLQSHQLQKYLTDTHALEALAVAFTDLKSAKPPNPIMFLANHLLDNAQLYDAQYHREQTDKRLEKQQQQNQSISQDIGGVFSSKQEDVRNGFYDDAEEDEDEQYLAQESKDKVLDFGVKAITVNYKDLEEEITVTAKPLPLYQSSMQNVKYVTTNLKSTNSTTTASKSGDPGQKLVVRKFAKEIGSEKDLISGQQQFNTEVDLIYYQKKSLISTDILADFKQDYQSSQNVLLQRLLENQNLQLTSTSETTRNNIHDFQNEQSVKKYLAKHSKFVSPLSVKELARGGEAVVYRVEHTNLEEIVAKCTLIQNHSNFEQNNQTFLDILKETQMLRLLKNEDHIAQVKEEMIEYNQSKSMITNYCVIVERAQHSLQNLLSIWRDPEQSERYQEFFSSQKLALYFYQMLSIIEYCHQRDVYYGDMKPANILVFRDQRLKLGDFGISIKLDSNPKDLDSKKYQLRGMTKGFCDEWMFNEFRQQKQLSRRQLFECDRQALIKTFEKCIISVKNLKQDESELAMNNGRPYYLDMCDDLRRSENIGGVLETWSEIFANNITYLSSLAEKMRQESKYEAVQQVYQLSKYKHYFKNRLTRYFKLFNQHSNQSVNKSGSNQISTMNNSGVNSFDVHQSISLNIDQVMIKRQERIYLPAPMLLDSFNQQLDQESQLTKFKNDLVFKHLLLEIIESKQLIKDPGEIIEMSSFDLVKKAFFQKEFSGFYFFESQDRLIKCDVDLYIDQRDEQKTQKTLNAHMKQFLDYFRYMHLLQDDIEYWVNFQHQMMNLMPLLQNNEYLRSIADVKRCLLTLSKPETSANPENLGYAQEHLMSYILLQDQQIKDKDVERQAIIGVAETFIRLNMYAEGLEQIEACYQKKAASTLNFKFLKLAVYYARMLNLNNYHKKSLLICNQWLDKWRDLLGDANKISLQFYGIIGENMLAMSQKGGNNNEVEQAMIYLYKYSKLGGEAKEKYDKIYRQVQDLLASNFEEFLL
eukprot:403346420